MIFVVNFDDPTIALNAYTHYNQQTFGIPYCYVKGMTGGDYPKVQVTENLFITSHGNDQEIGDAHQALGFTAVQLAALLKDLFPAGYKGSVYIAACNSFPEYNYALKEALREQGVKVQEVYGRKGATPVGSILPPGDNHWHSTLES